MQAVITSKGPLANLTDHLADPTGAFSTETCRHLLLHEHTLQPPCYIP